MQTTQQLKGSSIGYEGINMIKLNTEDAWLLQSIPEENTHSKLYLADLSEEQEASMRSLIYRKLVRLNNGNFKWLILTGKGRRALLEWERRHK